MTDSYIYAPVTGPLEGLGCYCSGTCTATCGGSGCISHVTPTTSAPLSGRPWLSPVDIGSSYSQNIYAWVDANITKIIVGSCYDICTADGVNNNTRDQGVYVDIYVSSTRRIAKVIYAHLFALSTGTRTRPGSSKWSAYLGASPNYVGDGYAACYRDVHVHMQAAPESGVGITNMISVGCLTNVTAQSGAVYKFSWT